MTQENKKVPLIVWSGGLDSTAILLQHVTNHEIVDLVSFSLANNKFSQQHEKTSQQKIIKIIKELYPDTIRKHYERKISPIVIEGSSLAQPIIWLTNSLYVLDPEQHLSIEFGYVKGDDFWHVYSSFKAAYKHLYDIFRVQEESRPELKFPLEWYDKETIIRDLFMQNAMSREIFDLVWVCEEECILIPCNNCPSCLKHDAAIKDYKDTLNATHSS